jgi:hypothetical protein
LHIGDHERVNPHYVVGARHPLGQQFKRIDAIQVISLDPQGIVTRAANLNRRPCVRNMRGRREVIRRTRLLKLRTLDAGDRADGYQQKMRPSLAIGKQGLALPILFGAKTVNPLAGCRVMPLQPMREALILHDLTQGVAVRA